MERRGKIRIACSLGYCKKNPSDEEKEKAFLQLERLSKNKKIQRNSLMKNMRLVWNGQDIKVEEAEKHILEILLRKKRYQQGYVAGLSGVCSS